MAELLDSIATFFEALVAAIGYPGIFFVMFLENIIPPIPTDPLLPFAGILVAEGKLNFWLVWLTAVSAAMIGSVMLYAVGMWADERVIRNLVRRYGRYLEIDEAALDRALVLFDRYGAPMIFFGRMVPILRTAVTITAGMSRMAIPKFLFYSILNSLAVTGFWITAGVIMGENWPQILEFINRFQWVILGVGGAGLAWMLASWWKRRRRRVQPMEAVPPEAPPPPLMTDSG
jgi:membrane protein DedA with SNARE-associated domain